MKLKSAVQRYQETSQNLIKISDSTKKISETNINLVDNTKQFLKKFENMKLEDKILRNHEDILKLQMEQEKQTNILKLVRILLIISLLMGIFLIVATFL